MAQKKNQEHLKDKFKALDLQGKESNCFKYQYGKEKSTHEIYCPTPCTVLEGLSETMTSHTPKNEELVIKRQGLKNAMIATHFPSHLIDKGETLKIETVSKTEETAAETRPQIHPKEKYVTFLIDTEGGKNALSKQLLKNPKLKKHGPFCVYGLRGEKLREALTRDGRFMAIVMTEKCKLMDKDNVSILTRQLVDRLDGRHFQITLDRKKNEGNNGDGSSENPRMMSVQETSQCNGPDEENTDDDLLKLQMCLKNEDFGKVSQSFSEVFRLQNLINFGKSVCKIDVGGAACGTGFVLFHNYVLTNAHLFENPCARSKMQLSVEVKCIFNYVRPTGEDVFEIHAKKELIDHQHNPDPCKRALDYAILELDLETLKPNDRKLPPGLLCKYGPVPERGEACLVGHPYGGVQRLDPTCIIPRENREKSIESVLMIKVNKDEQEDGVVTYNTYFFHGSSGSPVFDALGRVFGLHTAGMTYNTQQTSCNVMEYAHSLEDVLESFVGRLREDGSKAKLLGQVENVALKNLFLYERFFRPQSSDDETLPMESEQSEFMD
ncbi:serine protease FAM111A-like [Osmerus mordax]|uniref:serine protease FAM111A-like n=1 Tax=Osmerus mordax TaxID=8014 RepID=UPI00350ED479